MKNIYKTIGLNIAIASIEVTPGRGYLTESLLLLVLKAMEIKRTII